MLVCPIKSQNNANYMIEILIILALANQLNADQTDDAMFYVYKAKDGKCNY